jgi:hypothetical protein
MEKFMTAMTEKGIHMLGFRRRTLNKESLWMTSELMGA